MSSKIPDIATKVTVAPVIPTPSAPPEDRLASGAYDRSTEIFQGQALSGMPPLPLGDRVVTIETLVSKPKDGSLKSKIYSVLKVILIVMAIAFGVFALVTGAEVAILAAFIMLFGSFVNSLD